MNDTLDTLNQTYFDSNLDTNFNTAIKMCQNNYQYNELINFLNSEKIIEKQIAILALNKIQSKNDALTLVSNLVGQDGKIREAVAFKINELVKDPNSSHFFINEKVFDIFLQGIMDINGNVCRQIINLEGKCEINERFNKYLCKKLPESIRKILNEINTFEKKHKQYKINKRNFQLYWCLEALYNIIDVIDFSTIKEILFITGKFYDYTIREKTAKILAKIDNSEIDDLKGKLRNDENYYVRKYMCP